MISEFAPKIQTIGAMKGAHFLSIDQLNEHVLRVLLDRGTKRGRFRGEVPNPAGNKLGGRTINLDFRQPSTRTLESFETAIHQLGGRASVVRAEGTSTAKGETWRDELLVRSVYCHGMVIRDKEPTFIHQAAQLFAEHGVWCPLINGGNGPDEHPTQALGDLATIMDVMDRDLEGMWITIVGDLKNGRTVHSLLKGLNTLGRLNIQVTTRSLPGLQLPEELKSELGNLLIEETGLTAKFESDLERSNIWYWTRTQREHPDSAAVDVKDDLVLTADFAHNPANTKHLRGIMHPLPRVGEIERGVDSHPLAHYFTRQLRWNVTMRQVLLEAIFSG